MRALLALTFLLAGCGGGETAEAQCRRLAREAFPVAAQLADEGSDQGKEHIAREVLKCVSGGKR
jgi:hypothetical protein